MDKEQEVGALRLCVAHAVRAIDESMISAPRVNWDPIGMKGLEMKIQWVGMPGMSQNQYRGADVVVFPVGWNGEIHLYIIGFRGEWSAEAGLVRKDGFPVAPFRFLFSRDYPKFILPLNGVLLGEIKESLKIRGHLKRRS